VHDGTAEQRLDIEQALATLTPHARRIVELRAYGYRYQEIARLLQTTEAAVKMQVKRAFEKMRQLLLLHHGR
jgi:RNA polymerase sigma-70 factor (ECF subfamily)